MRHMSGWYEVDADSEDLIGANYDTVFVTGDWLPAEPEVNYAGGFELTDIRDENNISLMRYQEDHDWLLRVQEQITDRYGDSHALLQQRRHR